MGPVKLSQVDLNLLVALDALLRTQNVTLAGREMGLSQPAMSAALRRLRDLFGDPLFERMGAEYRLTPLAEGLAEPLKAALCAVQRTLDHNSHFDPLTSTRSFRLALSDHLLVVLCPLLIQRLHELGSSVRLHTRQVTPEVGAHLAARQLDLSIQPANMVSYCSAERLFDDRWVCAVWSCNRDVAQQLTVDQLYSMPHASFGPNPPSLAERLLVPPLGRKPIVKVTTRSFACLPFMLHGTPLLAVIQQTLGAWARERADIRLLDLPVPTPALSFDMCWNSIYTQDPAHRWLRGLVTEVAARSFGSQAGTD